MPSANPFDLDQLAARWLPPVEAILADVAREDSPAGSSLPEMLDYHLETGGKRLRALLPLAVADALGRDPAELVPFAAACEMLHNATLVHDDVQDGDTVRRGRETVWKRWGVPRAINLGDAMFYWATRLLQRLERPAELREATAGRLMRQTLEVIDGQEREFLLQEALGRSLAGEGPAPDLDGYLRMVRGKTSALFDCCLGGAAALCDAPAELVSAIEEAGDALGILFQIQDDILDLYGEKGRERRGSDIAEGKLSVLAIHFIAHGPPGEVAELETLLSRPREEVSDSDIATCAERFELAGTLRYALESLVTARQRALDTEAIAARPELRALLAAVADKFVAPIAGVAESRGVALR